MPFSRLTRNTALGSSKHSFRKKFVKNSFYYFKFNDSLGVARYKSDPSIHASTVASKVLLHLLNRHLSVFTGMKNLYSRIPDLICSFNPCLSEHCLEIRDQCVVDLKCRPVFIGIDKRLIPPRCQGKDCNLNGTLRDIRRYLSIMSRSMTLN